MIYQSGQGIVQIVEVRDLDAVVLCPDLICADPLSVVLQRADVVRADELDAAALLARDDRADGNSEPLTSRSIPASAGRLRPTTPRES